MRRSSIVLAALIAVGCNSVLGLDPRPLRETGAGGETATGGGGVTTSAGGMATTTSAGGMGGSAGGSGGAGGVAGGGGEGGVGGAPVDANCAALAGMPTGTHVIDPDLGGPIAPFNAHCDMDFDGGGWTLILVTSGGMGPSGGTPGIVLPATNAHMPMATMVALANISSQVHVRTAGQPATRSATSVADSLPIVNLRLAKMLERTAAAYSNSHWVMGSAVSHANMVRINGSQECADAEAADAGYPQIYQACNNADGLHLLGGLSLWDFNSGGAESMEVYVR